MQPIIRTTGIWFVSATVTRRSHKRTVRLALVFFAYIYDIRLLRR